MSPSVEPLCSLPERRERLLQFFLQLGPNFVGACAFECDNRDFRACSPSSSCIQVWSSKIRLGAQWGGASIKLIQTMGESFLQVRQHKHQRQVLERAHWIVIWSSNQWLACFVIIAGNFRSLIGHITDSTRRTTSSGTRTSRLITRLMGESCFLGKIQLLVQHDNNSGPAWDVRPAVDLGQESMEIHLKSNAKNIQSADVEYMTVWNTLLCIRSSVLGWPWA
jgi:hypothetical protein